MENQRRHARIGQGFSVSFHEINDILGSGERSKNLSESGLCLPLNHYYEVGSLLELEIRSDELKVSVKAVARVAWIIRQDNRELPFQAGLEFTDIAPAQRELLRECIKRHLASGGQQDVRWFD
jgi:Tfp pilus assembly protein PilZ